MRLAFVLTALLTFTAAADPRMKGAWQHTLEDGTIGTMIITDEHFSVAWYRKDPAKFVATDGGMWSARNDGTITVTYEFDTANPERVGTSQNVSVQTDDAGVMTVEGSVWKRIDDGAPGALHGSWLMTGRKRDGEITTRTPGARRTMKILSGTRFQWIAYNVETKQFFGTGGGTYTTAGGTYTENIEFFSRDDKKAGRSLEFRYDMVDKTWHHIGKSTDGNDMHEVWARRKDIGV
jgi:hypothetical protein